MTQKLLYTSYSSVFIADLEQVYGHLTLEPSNFFQSLPLFRKLVICQKFFKM